MIYFITYLLSFWLVLNIVYMYRRDWFERHGFKLYYGFVLVWKRLSSVRSSSIVYKIAYASIPLSIYGLYVFYTTMIMSILARFYIVHVPGRPQLLVPGVNITGINLLYFVIAIVIAAAIHEFSHALVAKSHGIEVKGFGFALLLFLPIAFTEIDDEYYSKASLRSKAVTLMAGPASNILLALLVFGVILYTVNPYGLTIVGVIKGGLAEEYGLRENMVILEINNQTASLDLLRSVLEANETTTICFKVVDENGVVREVYVVKPGNVTKLGVYLTSFSPSNTLISLFGVNGALALIYQLYWIYIVNASLGMINIAPLFITDGGKLVYEITKTKNIGHIINTTTLAILVLALIP